MLGAALLCNLLVFMASALLIHPSEAHAQAYVIGSDPIDGSTIVSVPDAIHIFFDAPISSFSSASVYFIQNGNYVNVTATDSVQSYAQELVVPIKTPAQQSRGSYEVTWTAVANDDGRTTYGLIGFNVGVSSLGLPGTPTLGPTSSNSIDDIRQLSFTNTLSILWEWLVRIALVSWIAILFIEQIVLAKERGSDFTRQIQLRTYSLQWLCLLVLLFGECIALVLRTTTYAQGIVGTNALLQLSSTYTFSLSDLFHLLIATLYGQLWIVRMLAIISAMLLLSVSHRRYEQLQEQQATKTDALITTKSTTQTQQTRSTQTISVGKTTRQFSPRKTIQLAESARSDNVQTVPYRLQWFTLATIIGLTFVATNSITTALQPHLSAILFDFLALFSLGVWLGGFMYFGYILLPVLIDKELDYNVETLMYLLKRLLPFFIAGIAVQLVSTFFLDEASISNTQQLLQDPYGRTLLVQVALLILATLISLYVLFYSRPKIIHQALRLPVVQNDLPTRRRRRSALNTSSRRLAFSSKLLAVLGATILLCAAFLSFFAPPIHYPAIDYNAFSEITGNTAGQSNNAVIVQTQTIGTLSVTLLLTPNKSGYAHTAIVTITDQGQAVNDAQIKITTNMQVMHMGQSSITIAGGSPVYSATFAKQAAFNMGGTWNVIITIQRPKEATVSTTFQIQIAS